MNIAYISYWGIDDGLSKATVLPNIEILSTIENVENISLFSIERSDFRHQHFENQKIQHIPLVSKYKSFRLFNKIYDFLIFPLLIRKRLVQNKVDFLICRGAPAGAIGLKAIKNSSVKLVVESFEPHSEYMYESGVWSKSSLSYILEKKWEKGIKQKSKALITVSMNYQRKLDSENISAKVYFAPCCVKLDKFKFDQILRSSIRENLKITENRIVGVYVGKFGDIYLKEEFFKILRTLQDQLGDRFYFIILSPQSKGEIQNFIEQEAINSEMVKILQVDHNEVPAYLSASDYGLVTVKPSPHRKYCSPIKTGEYWANGLPALITEDIGDDSEIILKNKIGHIIDLKDINRSVQNFLDLLITKKRSQWAKEIVPIADQHRNFKLVENAYLKILGDIEKG